MATKHFLQVEMFQAHQNVSAGNSFNFLSFPLFCLSYALKWLGLCWHWWRFAHIWLGLDLVQNATRFLSKTTPQLQIQIFTGIRLIFDSDSTLLKIANPPQRIPILYQKLRLNRFPNLTWSPSDLSAVDLTFCQQYHGDTSTIFYLKLIFYSILPT